jgi:hypothetical protein
VFARPLDGGRNISLETRYGDGVRSRTEQDDGELSHDWRMTWVPFGLDADSHSALVDGTPEWMLNSLKERFDAAFRRFVPTDHYGSGYHENRIDRMRRMELASNALT